MTLGPSPGKTIYASFSASVPGDGFGPIKVGLYTTDRGSTWHLIPAPAGSAIEDFESFSTSGPDVLATFDIAKSYLGQSYGSQVPDVEATIDGGATWKAASFGCPPARPCVRNGSYNHSTTCPQVQVSTDRGKKWKDAPGLPGGPLACAGSPYLVAVSPDSPTSPTSPTSRPDELWAKVGSNYPLQISRDGGSGWSDVGLPPVPGFATTASTVPGTAHDPTSLTVYGDGSLQVLPDGALPLTSDQQGEPWELLSPGATRWCQPPGTPDTDNISDPEIIGSQLWWLFTNVNDVASGVTTTAQHVELSNLSC